MIGIVVFLPKIREAIIVRGPRALIKVRFLGFFMFHCRRAKSMKQFPKHCRLIQNNFLISTLWDECGNNWNNLVIDWLLACLLACLHEKSTIFFREDRENRPIIFVSFISKQICLLIEADLHPWNWIKDWIIDWLRDWLIDWLINWFFFVIT